MRLCPSTRRLVVPTLSRPSRGRVSVVPRRIAHRLDIDQNCRDVDRLELYQGIANCTPSGPNDGGLCVLKGSHLLHEQRFAEQGGWRAEQDLGVKENGYNMNDQDVEWYMAHGCEKLKVLANVGDLIRECSASRGVG